MGSAFAYPAAGAAQTPPDSAATLRAILVVSPVTPGGEAYGGDVTAVVDDDDSLTSTRQDGSILFPRLARGRHAVALTAPGCDVLDSPRDVTVPDDSPAEFVVRCLRPPDDTGGGPNPPVADSLSPPTLLVGNTLRVFAGEEFSLSAESDGDGDTIEARVTEGPVSRVGTSSLTFTAVADGAIELIARREGAPDSAPVTVRVEVLEPPEPRQPPEPRIRASDAGEGWVRLNVELVALSEEPLEGWRLTLVAARSDDAASDVDAVRDTLLHRVAPVPFSEQEFDRPRSTTLYRLIARGPADEELAVEMQFVVGPEETDAATATDTVADSAGLEWSAGLGSVIVWSDPASVIVPFVLSASVGLDEEWYLTLKGGLFPWPALADDPLFPLDPRPEYRARTQKMVSFGASVFPNGGRLGFSLSYVGAWEMVQELDYYRQRLHGPALGQRVRLDHTLSDLRLRFIGGLDLHYLQVSEYDEAVARWKFGLTPSVAVSLVFD